MKVFPVAFTGIVVAVHYAVAAISGFSFSHNGRFSTVDSISYRYSSSLDTTVNKIYLETGEPASGLDSQDMLLFTIRLIDNCSRERWEETNGVLADGNPDAGAYFFCPGRMGLAPGLYIAEISDNECTVKDTFRISGPQKPFRTVSGMVSAPPGASVHRISVTLDMDGNAVTAGAWTDPEGNYRIAIDRETAEAGRWKGRVRIDSRFENYSAWPAAYPLDFTSDNWETVNFSFVAASAVVQGRVNTAGSGPLPYARVLLQDPERFALMTGYTDTEGVYRFRCAPGSYLVQVDYENETTGYMVPPASNLQAVENDTVAADFDVKTTDTCIVGRVTVKNRAPAVVCGIGAYHAAVGHSRTVADRSGRFRIPVSSSAEKYTVCLEECEHSPVFRQMIVEGGKRWKEVRVGDTVLFNLIDKPEGGIRGRVVNTTGVSAKSCWLSLFDENDPEAAFHFELSTDGAYSFDGIPAGNYFVEAGMMLAGSEGVPLKIRKRLQNERDEIRLLSIKNRIVDGLDWKFSREDIRQSADNGTAGDGILFLTVVDSTKAMIEKGTVHFLDRLPNGKETVLPVYSHSIENRLTAVTITGVPNRPLYVAVELAGRVLMQPQSYEKFLTGKDGRPLLLSFVKENECAAEVTVLEEDRRDFGKGVIERDGNGLIKGTVTCNGRAPCGNTVALLYNIDSELLIRNVQVLKSGSYRFERVPQGNFRIVAVIDTNRDKNPETMAISDSILRVTGNEHYTGIDLSFAEKPAGSGHLAGYLQDIDKLETGMTVTVAALPVDTAARITAQLNEMAFMSAYRTAASPDGTFEIRNLPDGAYLVVAAAEARGGADAADSSKEVAFGAYGELLFAGEGGFPFNPEPVFVHRGSSADSIGITMVMRNNDDRASMVSAHKLKIPRSFALQSSRFDRTDGRMELEFAIPEDASVSFSLMDLRGRIIAEMPRKSYAPGFHIVNWNVDASASGTSADELYIVAMKSDRFTTQHVVMFVM